MTQAKDVEKRPAINKAEELAEVIERFILVMKLLDYPSPFFWEHPQFGFKACHIVTLNSGQKMWLLPDGCLFCPGEDLNKDLKQMKADALNTCARRIKSLGEIAITMLEETQGS